jgi:hypothetical protein
MRVWFYRHQAAGVCHANPFSAPLSDEQLEMMRASVRASHGEYHPRTGECYWDRVECVDTDAPPPPVAPADPSQAGKGAGLFADLVASGEGRIENPR